MKILVVKETRDDGESRVALTPEAVRLLAAKKHQFLIESGAGVAAGFSDDDYIQVGAEIFVLTSKGFPSDTLILRVKRPSQEREFLERRSFHHNTFMMGFLSPFEKGDHVASWQSSGITTFSFDLVETLSSDDPRNVQAAMSRIAGRLAFHDALRHYKGEARLQLTVIGTGPAGLSAALEARKNGVPVQLFGRQECYRAEVEAQRMTYHLLPPSLHSVDFIRPYLKGQSLVITATRTPREKAPILIDEESLAILPEGAVVIDLAVAAGGNVIGSKRDEVVINNGISIVNVSGYPKAEPRLASEGYAKCIVHWVNDVIAPNGTLLLEHPLLKESWVTHQGKCNPMLRFLNSYCN